MSDLRISVRVLMKSPDFAAIASVIRTECIHPRQSSDNTHQMGGHTILENFLTELRGTGSSQDGDRKDAFG